MVLSRRTRRRAPPVLAALLALVATALQGGGDDVVAAPAPAGSIERLSVGTDGTKAVEAEGDSAEPSVSADGRYIAFTSAATNLVAGQQSGGSEFNVFRYDRETGETVLVSAPFSATSTSRPTVTGNGDSFDPSISGDGRYVAFVSDADNLVQPNTVRDPKDAGGSLTPDVFLRDVETSATKILSVTHCHAATGEFSGCPSGPPFVFAVTGGSPAISADGRFVAFSTRPRFPNTTNLIPGPKQLPAGRRSVVVYGGEAGLENVSGADADGDSSTEDPPAISHDGRYVAFESLATNLIGGADQNKVRDVFVYDRTDTRMTRVSVDDQGGELPVQSREPSISFSGAAHRVAFVTGAAIDPEDKNDALDVYVRTTPLAYRPPSTKRVSVTASGGDHNGTGGFLSPAISGDGLWVVWRSNASNMVEGQSEECRDRSGVVPCSEIFVREVTGGTTERVSVSSSDDPSHGDSFQPSISRTGHVVSFDSFAPNLVADDTNGDRDVFARDRRPTLSVTPDPGVFPPLRTGDSTTEVFTAKNAGVGTLKISGVTVAASSQTDFTVVEDNCTNKSLSRPGTCTVSVTFKPSAASTRAADLVFTHDAGNSPYDLPLSGTGTAPGLSVSPNPGQFDVRPVGTSQRLSFIATNPGNGPLTVSKVTVEGTNAADFTASGAGGCTSSSVAPSGSCVVNVDFKPSAAGTRTAALVFTDDAPGSPHRVALQGTGTVPGIQITPNPGDFGSVPLATTGSLTFTARNPGAAPLTVSKVAVEGPNADDFAITSDGDACSGTPGVAPAGTCTVEVKFEPSADAVRTAELVFTDNAPGSPHKVALKGSGTVARIAITPNPADFGNRTVGTTSRQTFTVRNVGTAPLTMSKLVIAGADASAFVHSDDASCLRAPLPHDGFCTVEVAFTPSTTGKRSASLVVTDNAPGSPHPVPLSGVGTAPPKDPAITITPDPGDYGAQTVGNPTTMQFTAQSEGDKDLKISKVTVEGADRGEFVIMKESDSCTGASLPKGAMCSLMVTFTPGRDGNRSTQLVFNDNAPRSPQRVVLGGRGLAGLSPLPADPDPDAPTPTLTIDPPVAPTGSVVTVRGSGFTPHATVNLGWLRGLGTGSATTDGQGNFEAAMLIFHHDDLGWRQVEASDGRVTALANELVVPPEIKPRRFVQRG